MSAVKVAVVTGSNKGIGFAIVKALCKEFEGNVYLTARNEARGLAAVEELKKEGLDPKFHLLDIEKTDSIKTFAAYLKEKYGGIDILVNNAAMAYKMADTAPFAEQAENTIRVNFFANLDVCHQLFPLLRSHARVVNLSSSAGRLSNIPNKALQERFLDPKLTEEGLCELMKEFVNDAKDGTHKRKGWSSSTYQMSKIGFTALTFLQQKQFDSGIPADDIVANAVHPGYVDTDMSSHKGPLTPEQGADPAVYLALLPPNVTKPRGQYIWNDKTIAKWEA